MIEQNQEDLQQPHTSEEQLMLIQTHQHLKQMERSLMQQMGTVIIR
jgi:DNA primase